MLIHDVLEKAACYFRSFEVFAKNAKVYAYGDRLSELYQARLLLVRHDNNCGYDYEGRAYSQIVDSIIDLASSLEYNSLSVATPYSRLCGDLAYGEPFVFNRSFFCISLLSRILKAFFGAEKALNYKDDAQRKLWKRIIERVDPKIVIGIQPSGPLCAAGKELGVKVFDYQHGVISEDQWWYGKTLPYKVPREKVPDGFLCWDKISSNTLKKLMGGHNVEILALGNPWFNRFFNKKESDEIATFDFSDKLGLSKIKPNILVSLQWGLRDYYYKDENFNGLMSDSLVRVIRDTQSEYNWLIRLHPVQMRSANLSGIQRKLSALFLGCDSIEWRQTSAAPLPAVLKLTHLHITDMSTVITEAYWAGIRSCALNRYLKPGGKLEKLFQSERKSGALSVINDTESDVKDWIRTNISGIEKSRSPLDDSQLTSFLSERLK